MFGQHDWTQFALGFNDSACATTSIVNMVSTQYTESTGEKLSFDQAQNAIQEAINNGSVAGNDATVNNWTKAANTMAQSVGLTGTFTDYTEDATKSRDYTILAYTSTDNLDKAEHFVLVTGQVPGNAGNAIKALEVFNPDSAQEEYWVSDAVGITADKPAKFRPLQSGRETRQFNYEEQ
ncbi:MAG: hypothetical protein KBT02_09480 [Treponema sp.]|nr:hypothetical protein [Candidatus Treponema caballi]